MVIERVSTADTEELLAIYRPYVTDTAITFEYEVPTYEDFENRIRTISARFPYIKAVGEDGSILGYAYASTFKGRKAYDWSVETTVYVRLDCRRMGVGRLLYDVLEKSLADMGVLNANACIAVPKGEDAFLTMDSVCFHAARGYAEVGTFHDSGYKFNTWYDMIWMEKMLGKHLPEQPDVKFGAWEI